MSRRTSPAGPVALAAVAGGVAAVAALLCSDRVRSLLRARFSGSPADAEARAPAYMELPDRGVAADHIERAADRGTAGQAVRLGRRAAGVTAGV